MARVGERLALKWMCERGHSPSSFLFSFSLSRAIFIFDSKVNQRGKREGQEEEKEKGRRADQISSPSSLSRSDSKLYWPAVRASATSIDNQIHQRWEIANSDNSSQRIVPLSSHHISERVFIIVVDKQLHVCWNNSIAHTCVCSRTNSSRHAVSLG